MQTRVWGRPGWTFLHCIAHNYQPGVHKPNEYRAFFKLLGSTLPCKYCRQSYKRFFKQIPIENFMGSQKEMAYWLYLIHNKVNDKLRSQGLYNNPNPSFESIYRRYEQYRADCSSKKGKPATCRMPEKKDRCSHLTRNGRQCSRKQSGNGCCTQHRKCKMNQSRRKRSTIRRK